MFRFDLKGQDFKKNSLAEKVPQTLQNNEFMEFFSYLKLLDFKTKMLSRRPFNGYF